MIACHVIFGAYGFWLPNDPRGSWSDFIGSWELVRYGPIVRPESVQSVAHVQRDVGLRLAAKQALKYQAVAFSGVQARAIGRGFGQYVEKSGLVVRACAILPEHVHLVIDSFRYTPEQVVIQLKGAATERLLAEGLHPFGHLRAKKERVPKCWARGAWTVFLDTEDEVLRAMQYVLDNPVKEGKEVQRWPFVTPLVLAATRSASAAERGTRS
jgi:REP element-mobilizing transposase RayT